MWTNRFSSLPPSIAPSYSDLGALSLAFRGSLRSRRNPHPAVSDRRLFNAVTPTRYSSRSFCQRPISIHTCPSRGISSRISAVNDYDLRRLYSNTISDTMMNPLPLTEEPPSSYVDGHTTANLDHSLDTDSGTMVSSANPLQHYSFPTHRLKRVMNDSSKTPLCLVACGSFSPITYLHLRMFEMAADYVKFNTDYEVVGGYLSPVSDAYKKAGLASAHHRIRMCDIAATQTSNWLMVDSWEPLQKEYQPTALVLDHFDHEINDVRGGVETYTGDRKHVQIALLAGADLIQTMSTPGVWSDKDLDHILGRYGTFIVERTGTDIDDALASLQQWKENIHVIQQLIQNDVSSTKIRLFLRREMSVHYLVPAPVIEYIEENGLYEEDAANSTASLHEKKDKGIASTAEVRASGS